MVKVLMVCLGNICRSPMAEGILRQKAEEMGISIQVDSAGFVPYHRGDSPDQRAMLTARKHGIDISSIRSRTFEYEDFKKFDYIYVMDRNNYDDVMDCAKTEEDRKKVDFILNAVFPKQNQVVPDPYYGGINGFENVYSMLDTACTEICNQLRKQ